MKIGSRYTLGFLIGFLWLQTTVQANPWAHLAATTTRRVGLVAAVTSPSWAPFIVGYHSGKKEARVGQQIEAISHGDTLIDKALLFSTGMSLPLILSHNLPLTVITLATIVPIGSYGIGKIIGAESIKK